jgi:thiamine pyrophosphate-dependent acetolactate synthase large subunit-like protein
MKTTASDVLIDAIHDWGVEVVFGLPGDGINGVMEALRKRADKIRFIQVRHEEAAAFMACGYAKYTGKLGVCLATSGPGGLHLTNGLYDAKLDGAPVLAITGLQYHDLIHTHTQQDVELDKVFMDVAVYNTRVMGASHVERNKYRKFLSRAQSAMHDWWKLIEDYGTRTDKPMKPQVVAWELGKCLAEDAIIPCDSGTVATWWARHIPTKRGQMHSLSGNLASMAPALPYAIAAEIAYPDRQSLAFVGDGGFSMLMAEFATCVKYKLPVKVFVIKNNSLGQIKWEQMVFLGNPEYGCDLQPINFALFAQACGGTGLTVDDPKDCGRVVDQALNTPGPVLVEAVVDPYEPPMPPKVSIRQAEKFAESLLRGEPNRTKIVATIAEDRVRELV